MKQFKYLLSLLLCCFIAQINTQERGTMKPVYRGTKAPQKQPRKKQIPPKKEEVMETEYFVPAPEDVPPVAPHMQPIKELMMEERKRPRGRELDQESLRKSIKAQEPNNVKELLETGFVDVNEQYEGQSLLHIAVESGYKLIIQLLLDHGADMNARDQKGRTPLQLAVELGMTGAASVLQNYANKQGR